MDHSAWFQASAAKYSAFGKSLCTYKRCWKWCPRASIQAWTRLILFANTFCRSACEMFLMYAVNAVFNSLSVCVGHHDTVQILTTKSTYRSLSTHRLSESTVDENCALLDYYAASSSNSLLTFRDNITTPSSRVKQGPEFLTLHLPCLTLADGADRLSRIVVPNHWQGIITTRCVIAENSAVLDHSGSKSNYK